MTKYFFLYLSLFVFAIFVLTNPGGQNATNVPGDACTHATDCNVTSYLPVSIERAGETVTAVVPYVEVYIMLGVLVFFGIFSGFVETHVSFWRPMYFVMAGTTVALMPGINDLPTGSLLIPFMPLELWIAVLGGVVCFFSGAFRLIVIGMILGFCFSKLAFMSAGGTAYQLFILGTLLVIADHIVSSFLRELKQKNNNEVRERINRRSVGDGTHDIDRHAMKSSSSINFGENLGVR